jgi:hypothetical protein
MARGRCEEEKKPKKKRERKMDGRTPKACAIESCSKWCKSFPSFAFQQLIGCEEPTA